ncbi:MAG: urea ABC transporter ATP-binding subunit UrtE [Dehalococcoidia bacterium]
MSVLDRWRPARQPGANANTNGTHIEAFGLHISYGRSTVVRDLSLQASDGSVVCVLGRNGAGKTTLLKAIMGVLPSRGAIRLSGRDISRSPSYRRAKAGMGYVPQGRGIFPYLSVRENLLMGLEPVGGKDTGQMEEVFQMFPVVKQMLGRTAGVLSGGQQQQLAIGRALMGRPSLLLLDEPTEGIQPNIVEEIEAVIGSLRGKMTILLVEQFLGFALANADYCYVIEQGSITVEGSPAQLDRARLQEALAV